MDDTAGEIPCMRCRGLVSFQKINPSTGMMTATEFAYNTKFENHWTVDDEEIEANKYFLESGEAVYLKNELENDEEQKEEVYFLVSGEVELTPFTLEVAPGYSMIGNLTPVKVDLADVLLYNCNKVLMDDTAGEIPCMRCRGLVSFQKINTATGMMTATEYAYNSKFDNHWTVDDEEIERGVYFLNPGEAVYLKNELENDDGGLESVYLKFPNPLGK